MKALCPRCLLEREAEVIEACREGRAEDGWCVPVVLAEHRERRHAERLPGVQQDSGYASVAAVLERAP